MISSGPSSVCKTSKKVQDTHSRTPTPHPQALKAIQRALPTGDWLNVNIDVNIVFMEQSHIRFVRPMRQQCEKNFVKEFRRNLRAWFLLEFSCCVFLENGWMIMMISFRCNQPWPTTPSSRRITATPPCHTPPTGPPCPTRANRNTTPFTRPGRAPLRAPTPPPPEGPPQDRRWCPTTPTMRGEWCPPKGTRQAMDHHSSLDTTTGKSHPILESPTFPVFPPGKIILSKIDENNSTTIVHHLK